MHLGCVLTTHWRQKDGHVISRQFVLLNIKRRSSWPYVSKAASFPVASLFLYPAATHCYCHICPLARGIECLASPEATVNASFLLYWLGMHLASLSTSILQLISAVATLTMTQSFLTQGLWSSITEEGKMKNFPFSKFNGHIQDMCLILKRVTFSKYLEDTNILS